MTGFAKLWSSIVHSTVWRESAETKVVWITLLAISDSGGYVGASLPGLADLARVDLPACEAALARLKAPDPHSRTKEHEGRRIEDRDGGWFILNYRKHREGIDVEIRRAQNREAAKRHREKLAAMRKASAEPSAPSAESAPVSSGKPLSAQAVKQGCSDALEATTSAPENGAWSRRFRPTAPASLLRRPPVLLHGSRPPKRRGKRRTGPARSISGGRRRRLTRCTRLATPPKRSASI